MVIGADILSLLRGQDSFIITTHISPDGDGIGSALALSRGLKAIGKEVIILNHSKTPDNLRFLLKKDSEIIGPGSLDAGFDPMHYFSVVVDMGAFDRLGSVLPIIEKCKGMLEIGRAHV